MASPGRVDLQVYQGDRFELFFRVRSQVLDVDGETYIPGPYVDLTGWTPTAEVRLNKADVTPAATFACSLGDQVATPGSVLCVLLPASTLALTSSTYYYDVQLKQDATHITTYLQGVVYVTPEVTRG